MPHSITMGESSDLANHAAPLLEVFASIQGEGLYVGELQTFVRLRGCPLRCRWCDTPASWTIGEHASARIDAVRGSRREIGLSTPFQVACYVAECEPAGARTISLTGGEPLLFPDFILALRGFIGGRRLHLETAGAHPEALERVLPVIDHVSLDLKLPLDLDPPVELPSLGSTPVPRSLPEWAETRARNLELLRGRDACAKIIVSGDRAVRDFDELFESVAEYAPELTVIVQPATATGAVRSPTVELVTTVAERARALDLAVRILPQMHRALGVP